MSTRFRARTRFGRPSYVAVTRRSTAQKVKYLWRVSRRKKQEKEERKRERNKPRNGGTFFAIGKVLSVVELPHLVGARARSCDRDSEIIPITLDPYAPTSSPSHLQHYVEIPVQFLSLSLLYPLASNY